MHDDEQHENTDWSDLLDADAEGIALVTARQRDALERFAALANEES